MLGYSELYIEMEYMHNYNIIECRTRRTDSTRARPIFTKESNCLEADPMEELI